MALIIILLMFVFPKNTREMKVDYVVTEDGNIWETDSTIVFDTKGTLGIEDDEIIGRCGNGN